MLMWEIRAASDEQAERLTTIALASKAFWGYTDEFMRACQEELAVTEKKIASTKFDYFVAISNDIIGGFYALEQLDSNQFELEALFVEPDSIGKGLGKLLYCHATELAQRKGAKALVIQGDPNAEPFYSRMGATLVGEKRSLSIANRTLPLFKVYFD